MNKKARVYAEFSIDGIDRGTSKTFEKCMLHFSPRFEVTTGLPAHLSIQIKTPPKPPDETILPEVGPMNPKVYKYKEFDFTEFGFIETKELKTLAELYEAVKLGTIRPDSDIKYIKNWKEANDIPLLKKLFDKYYWYKNKDKTNSKPYTLRGLYDVAKAGTIEWDTKVMGPGLGDWKNAAEIPELLPVLNRWYHEPVKGPFTEVEMHTKLNDPSIGGIETMELNAEPGDDWRVAKEWEEFEAKFTSNCEPRTLEFRFPVLPETEITELEPFVIWFTNIVFKYFCQMLGLSDNKDPALSDSYKNPNAYKKIVQACVNDDQLDVTMWG